MSLRIGIVGASGRLGRRIRAGADEAGWRVVLTATSRGWYVESAPEVLVDVSHRSALGWVVSFCVREEIPLVHGVSGLGDEEQAMLGSLSEQVAVVRAPNFTYGHLLQLTMLEAAVEALARSASSWEATVVERHPLTKADRPSATALELADGCADGGVRLGEVASVRGGPPVSDHSVLLTAGGETVTLVHAVSDLSAAAGGALRAAEWVAGRPPGLWSMRHVYESHDHGFSPTAAGPSEGRREKGARA